MCFLHFPEVRYRNIYIRNTIASDYHECRNMWMLSLTQVDITVDN